MSGAALAAGGSEPLSPVVPARRLAPTPRRVLAIASLGAAVAFVDATIVNIAFPSIAKSFSGTSIGSLSWVLNAYNIVFAAFLVAAGPDRRPARAAAHLRVRPGVVHGRLGAVRGRPVGRRAGRRSGSCRRWGRPSWYPPRWRSCWRPSRPIAGPTAWRCCRRWQRPPPGWGRRSAGSWCRRPTGGWCSWSTFRSGSWPSCSPAGSWSRAVRPDGGACPTCSGRWCSRSRSPRSCSAW